MLIISLNNSDINQEQYNAVTETVSRIYSELNEEESDLIKEFSNTYVSWDKIYIMEIRKKDYLAFAGYEVAKA